MSYVYLAGDGWAGLGASDSPPCDVGWIEVTDDAGHLTCVQPSAGDSGYCGTGKTVYIDASGSPVCYPILPGGSGGITIPGLTPGMPPPPMGQGSATNWLSSLGTGGGWLLAAILLLVIARR